MEVDISVYYLWRRGWGVDISVIISGEGDRGLIYLYIISPFKVH